MPPRPTRILLPPAVAGLALAALAACADSTTAPAGDIAAPRGPSFGVVSGAAYADNLNFAGAFASEWISISALSCDGQWDPTWACIAPKVWTPSDFDVVKHMRDRSAWYVPQRFRAMHGDLCQPYQTPEAVTAANPSANAVQHGAIGSHPASTYEDLNYRCRNHMMTSLKASGYGVIYVTPNALVDIPSAGEAVIKFNLSTLRTHGDDWVDIWISPWEDNLELPLDADLAATDLQGPPRRGIHVRMTRDKSRSAFEAFYIKDFQETKLPSNAAGYESIILPVSTRRDLFELRISRSHVKFGMSKLAGTPNEPAGAIVWVDAELPAALDWSQGVVQFGHHSLGQTIADNDSVGGTWHWDNFSMAPATQFRMVKATARYADAANPVVTFPEGAPAGAFLRFAGFGEKVEVSFDGERTWQKAERQLEKTDVANRFHSYWTPAPAGVTSVAFRAKKDPNASEASNRDQGPWMVRDIAFWAR